MPEVTAQRLQPQPVVPEPLPLPPVLPLPQLSQSKQKQHFLLFSLVTPPTLPLLWQQGLQHDCPTKLGNVMPPKKPQELHISPYLHKIIPTRNGRV